MTTPTKRRASKRAVFEAFGMLNLRCYARCGKDDAGFYGMMLTEHADAPASERWSLEFRRICCYSGSPTIDRVSARQIVDLMNNLHQPTEEEG